MPVHFHFKGCWVVFLFFIQILKGISFTKKTVENLIRRRVLWRLVWFCTVCRCPTRRTLDFYGLSRIDFPTISNRAISFPFLGCCWVVSYLDRTIYKQTVETLIRHRFLRRLIWVHCLPMSPKMDARLIWVKHPASSSSARFLQN